MTPELSVIIPCYASAERPSVGRLRLALQAYGRQTLPRDRFEVIVVDDGSVPPLDERFAQWELPPGLCRIVRQAHAGMCSAYATGLEAARGEIVFLGIDDNVPSPDCLQEHVAAHARAKQPCVIAGRELFCLSMVDDLDPDACRSPHITREMAAMMPKLPSNAAFEDILPLAFEIAPYQDIESVLAQTDYLELSGGWLAMRVGNHSMPIELFRQIGGMDPLFDPDGVFSDIDLGLRVWKARLPIHLREAAVMIHLHHGWSAAAKIGLETKLSLLVEKHRDNGLKPLRQHLDSAGTIVTFSTALDAMDPSDRYF